MLGGVGKSLGIGGGAAPAVAQAAGAALPALAAAAAPVTGGASLAALPLAAGAGALPAAAGAAEGAAGALPAMGSPALADMAALGGAANPYLEAMGGAGMPGGLGGRAMQQGFADYIKNPQAGQAALQAATPTTQQVPQSGISGGDIAKAGLSALTSPGGGPMSGGLATNAQQANPIQQAIRQRQQAAGAQQPQGGGGAATPAVTQVPQRQLRPQFMPSQMPMAGGGPAGPPAPGNQSAMMRMLQMLGGGTALAGGY